MTILEHPTARPLLRTDQHGSPLKTLNNIAEILTKDEAWRGVLGYDSFAKKIVVCRPPPYSRAADKTVAWEDNDDRMTLRWIESNYKLVVGLELVQHAVCSVSDANRYHPVREYLSALVWDEEPRLDMWLTTVFAAIDNEYTRAAGASMLIAAVARVFVPGCKADCMLILEGPQGSRKSSAIETLCGNEAWFLDELPDMGTKDAAELLAGRWIVELAELDTLARSEVSAVKAFLSRKTDRYRPAYGRHTVDQRRECVFFGTVNRGAVGYLKDDTGARRFLPIETRGPADIDWLVSWRDQLWAEARERFEDGQQWHLTPAVASLASGEQELRRQSDDWDRPVAEWLSLQTRPCVTGADVMSEALQVALGKQPKKDQMRVADCIKRAGWERCWPKDVSGKTYVAWRRPTTTVP